MHYGFTPTKRNVAMPQTFDFIDRIARQKQRDVLYVHFSTKQYEKPTPVFRSKKRHAFIMWLEEQDIDFYSCAEPLGAKSKTGERDEWDLYIDVPFDTAGPQYQLLSGYLED